MNTAGVKVNLDIRVIMRQMGITGYAEKEQPRDLPAIKTDCAAYTVDGLPVVL